MPQQRVIDGVLCEAVPAANVRVGDIHPFGARITSARVEPPFAYLAWGQTPGTGIVGGSAQIPVADIFWVRSRT